MTPCRHCHQRKASRPKGLCYRCSADDAIRTAYTSLSVFGRTSEVRDYYGPSAQPATATDAVAGSEEKIRVLEARALMGESLFGAKDRRFNWRRETPGGAA